MKVLFFIYLIITIKVFSYDFNDFKNALESKNLFLAKKIINSGFDVNKEDTDGTKPFDIAILSSQDVIINLLLEKKVDIDFVDLGGNTYLHKACEAGNLWLAGELVGKRPGFLKVANNDGNYPVSIAVINDDCKLARMLLENGASINTRIRNYYSLLEYSVTSCSLEMVKLLIEKGADVNEKNLSGETPLFYVRYPDIARFILENGGDVNYSVQRKMTGGEIWSITPLYNAISDYNDKLTDCYLENDADINHELVKDFTLFHYYISKMNNDEYGEFNTGLLDKFIRHGARLADIFIGPDKYTGKRESIPLLIYALSVESPVMALYFMGKGVDINKSASEGRYKDVSPLYFAIYKKKDNYYYEFKIKKFKRLILELVYRGADITKKSKKIDSAGFESPLDFAKRINDEDLVKYLATDSGKNAIDQETIFNAIEKKDIKRINEIIKINRPSLFEEKTVVLAGKKISNDPVSYAINCGDIPVLDVLLKALKNDFEITGVHLEAAVTQNNPGLLKYLLARKLKGKKITDSDFNDFYKNILVFSVTAKNESIVAYLLNNSQFAGFLTNGYEIKYLLECILDTNEIQMVLLFINSVFKDKESLGLYMAVVNNDLESVKALIDKNKNDDLKIYLVFLAEGLNHLKLLEFLSGKLFNMSDAKIAELVYHDLIHRSLTGGRLESLKILLSFKDVMNYDYFDVKKFSGPDYGMDYYFNNLMLEDLITVSNKGYVDVLRFVFKNYPDILKNLNANRKDLGTYRIYEAAVMNERTGILKILYDYRLIPQTTSNDYSSVLEIAAEYDKIESLKFIIDEMYGKTPGRDLIVLTAGAALYNMSNNVSKYMITNYRKILFPEYTKMILDNLVNNKTMYGDDPVFNNDIISLLFNEGIDIKRAFVHITINHNAVNGTLLHAACVADNIELVKILLSNGADVNATDDVGFPPVYYAVIRDNADILGLLLNDKRLIKDMIVKCRYDNEIKLSELLFDDVSSYKVFKLLKDAGF